MIKRIFSKLYNIIQWTKKWHFFHVFLFFTVTIWQVFIMSFLLSELITNNFKINNIINNILSMEAIIVYFFAAPIVYFASFLAASLIQIIMSFICVFSHKGIKIKSEILQYNKEYNSIYSFSFIYSALFLILFGILLNIENDTNIVLLYLFCLVFHIIFSIFSPFIIFLYSKIILLLCKKIVSYFDFYPQRTNIIAPNFIHKDKR